MIETARNSSNSIFRVQLREFKVPWYSPALERLRQQRRRSELMRNPLMKILTKQKERLRRDHVIISIRTVSSLPILLCVYLLVK